MNPLLKFLAAARNLSQQGFKKEQIYDFAKREFGEVNELMKKQIDNIFKPQKPVAPKDPDFDNTIKKLGIDEEGKPFNPKDPLKNMATGGRAGYYGGGITNMVGEDLSEIGHGADALMARNMQLAPNGQATTSTGLNYLLGQDNDTVRVPYGKGKIVKEVADQGRRGFIKAAGAGAAGIAALKTGLLGFGEKVAPAAYDAAKDVKKIVEGVPPYFMKLVNKIRKLGDDITETGALADRQNVKQYKDYTLTEDVSTGRLEIQKIKNAAGEEFGLDNFGNGLTEEVYMSYKPGEVLEGAGKIKPLKTADEYEEGTAYLRNDGPNTGDVYEEVSGVTDEIFEEVGETIVKKADGGRIGYSKGKIVKGIAGLLKKKKKPKMMNADELEDFEMEIGDNLEAYDFDGTVEDGARILKEQKDYMDDMFLEYKKGNLDPVAGDKSPARKRFLEKKLEDAEMSGDNRLMTYDEVEELSAFDLGTEMDNAKLSTNDEIKQGVASIMKDTSPAALEKSMEVDNLMLKYEGMDRRLAEQIATEANPRKKADIIAMVEQTIKMGETGKSGDEIIEIFKNTTRTKQASGGLATMLGE